MSAAAGAQWYSSAISRMMGIGTPSSQSNIPRPMAFTPNSLAGGGLASHRGRGKLTTTENVPLDRSRRDRGDIQLWPRNKCLVSAFDHATSMSARRPTGAWRAMPIPTLGETAKCFQTTSKRRSRSIQRLYDEHRQAVDATATRAWRRLQPWSAGPMFLGFLGAAIGLWIGANLVVAASGYAAFDRPRFPGCKAS